VTWTATALTERLGIEYPIVQAPMSGWTPPEIVAAVSNAGGLGSLGAARMSPDALRVAIHAVRRLTDRPFNVNVFTWRDTEPPDREDIEAVEKVLGPYRQALGLGEDAQAPFPASLSEMLDGQLAVICEERVPVLSFTFGIPPLEEVKQTGGVVLGTATSVAEAIALQEAGVDMVVAQGGEAGGHRGTFRGSFEQSLVGVLALVPQVVDSIDAPVIAAGGIMDGRGIAAALALGASGAQLGTAFAACPESGAPEAYKRALAGLADTATCVTDVYTGRPARAVRTPLITELETRLADALEFPLQSSLTGPIHEMAAQRGESDLMFMLAGQAAGLSRSLPAAELLRTLAGETDEVLDGLTRRA
jgi:nitronate monooxygenase